MTTDCSGTPAVQPRVTKLPMIHIGRGSGDEFPMIDRLWEHYASKGVRTVFISVGASRSVLADLDITESLGCPANIIALSDLETEKWAEVADILKTRKRDMSGARFSFSEMAETKWILPKNIRPVRTLPWWRNGTLSHEEQQVHTVNVREYVESICTAMKLKDNIRRIDVLKVDTTQSAPGLEIPFLQMVLTAGYRPGIVLVNWTEMPDVDLQTTITAGFLQNMGYRLLDKVGSKFLYYFTDSDLYQVCSWEDTTCENPLVKEIVESVRSSV